MPSSPDHPDLASTGRGRIGSVVQQHDVERLIAHAALRRRSGSILPREHRDLGIDAALESSPRDPYSSIGRLSSTTSTRSPLNARRSALVGTSRLADLERHVNAECASVPGSLSTPIFAAHQLDQARGDREPSPVPPTRVSSRLDLREGLEERAACSGGMPMPGVTHCDAQTRASAFVARRRPTRANLAALGELHGVADRG